ncbi:MAG TPA: winged helix-turn-helix domain-containing protein [Pyrinomonadaceae bacterium]|nr:winged helix-turn-helix domain-containing protein [Pyrinomonadaceae bacterium]
MKSPIYEFGPFVLEPHARRLSRNGESVQLAAPEFELLLLLVSNQGRVVEKKEIMDAVWPDAAVEENNLTVRMSSLRRALGETKGHHPYIQTVTGRGYCLIVPVKTVETEVTAEQAIAAEAPVAQPPATPLPPPETTRARWEMRGSRLYAFVLVVVLALSALSAVLLRKRGDKSSAAIQSMKLTRLTHTGRVMGAGMSLDGQNIAYVERYDEMSSLWLQRAGTNAPLQLLPPAKPFLRDPSFSRDGNTVYYTKCEPNCRVYKIPVLGGVETALGFRSDGRVTFSPDGKRMAYVRGTVDETGGVFVNVFVANVNGTEEKALNWQGGGTSYQGGAPAWSPDGKVVAVSMLFKEGNRSYYNVLALGVDDGTNSTLISQWRSIRDVNWLPDGSGLIFNGLNEGAEGPGMQIWHVPLKGGEPRRITNDLNNYVYCAMSEDGTKLIAAQIQWTSGLWIGPAENPTAATQLTTGTIDRHDGDGGISMTHDGRIVYISNHSGKRNLWSINSDGSGVKQLTDAPPSHHDPSMTPDGRYIVFETSRDGGHNIWRVDADGRNPRRLTRGRFDSQPTCSRDSKWVVYVGNEDEKTPKLYKVSIDGGDSVRLTDEFGMQPEYSPDGKTIAYYRMNQKQRDQRHFVIIPAEGGAAIKTIPVPKNFGSETHWDPSGNALCYRTSTLNGIGRQPLDGTEASTIVSLRDRLYTFSFSLDGRRLAYASGPNLGDVILFTGFNSLP